MVKQPPRLTLPDPPGIGVEINDDFFASHSYTPSAVDIPPRDDGSVAER
jgi:L-alanine-DL-glutamate epimerase-like enolase superfamily enzyme